MADQALWNAVSGLRGRQLSTLDRGNKFAIRAVESDSLVIHVTTTGKLRTIHRSEIEDSHAQLLASGEISREEIERNYSPRNPVYVAAILASLPSVEYRLKPIRLLMRKAGATC